MKVWPIATAALLALLVAGVALAAEPGPARTSAGGTGTGPDVRMGVVLNSLDNTFFVAIYEGMRAEASRRRVDATVRSVTSNAELRAQAAQARVFVAQKKDCYVVNPITATNLVAPLRGLRRPIINIDSPIDPVAAERAGVRIRSYIGTDDFAAGRIGGRRMASLLHGSGEVALVGGLARNVNSGVRLRGFERGLQGSRVRVVTQVNADYDRTKAEIAAGRILRAHPHISGFFAASDLMALGIADAVLAAGKTGRVRIIGLDGIPEALDAIQAGSLDATVSQYPYVMGQMAVEACAAAARGARLPTRVDAPIALLTRANVTRAITAFPKPFQRYSDPFSHLLRG